MQGLAKQASFMVRYAMLRARIAALRDEPVLEV